MSIPDPILSRLGVPHRRRLVDLARLMGVDRAQVSRGEPAVLRVCGYAADLLDGTATGTAELVDPGAWARALELVRRIGEEDGAPDFSAETLAAKLKEWGIAIEPLGALLDLGAEDRWRRGGWAEVRRWVQGVLR